MHGAWVTIVAAGLLVAEAEPLVDSPPAKLQALKVEMLGDGGANYVPVVDYGLEATLDPDAKTVTGRGRLIWTNTGSQPISALWWHLYLNAFRNEASTFLRASKGVLRNDSMKPGQWGWIEVTAMSARDLSPGSADAQADLLAARSFEHPDDDNADDRTVMRTPLPFSVAPGGAVEISFEFKSKLPYVFARSGFAKDFFMVAQWFPKLGVLQETFRPPQPGQSPALDAYGEPAWNCHQYHAHSEFFADYGVFRAALRVPKGWIVGATGLRVGTQDNQDGTITYEYAQDRVHDFAWTADRRFVEKVRTFDDTFVRDEERAEVAALIDARAQDLRLSPVEVRLLLQPEHEEYAERYFEAIFAGLKWFGLWYGAYPYRTLTLVDGPRGSGGAMGMEYPTLVTGGVSWPSPPSIPRPEAVTVHEFGHQYWYGLVGSNEFEESWLDEGFNTYSTGKVLDRAYGSFVLAPKVLSVPLTPWFSKVRYDQADVFRMGTMWRPEEDAVVRPSWGYRDARSYSVNSYPRPANVLKQLEWHLGESTMAQAMRVYHARYRYRHPTTEDFIAVVEEVAARDLSRFFERALHTAGKVDYGIESLISDKVVPFAGIFSKSDSNADPTDHTEVTIEQAESDAEAAEGPGAYRTEVLVARYGDVPFAHTMDVYFTDGSTQTVVWDGEYRWKRFVFEDAPQAVSARLYTVQPQVLDVRPSNDTRTLHANPRPGLSWGAQVQYWAQTALDVLGMLL